MSIVMKGVITHMIAAAITILRPRPVVMLRSIIMTARAMVIAMCTASAIMVIMGRHPARTTVIVTDMIAMIVIIAITAMIVATAVTATAGNRPALKERSVSALKPRSRNEVLAYKKAALNDRAALIFSVNQGLALGRGRIDLHARPHRRRQ